MKYALSALCSLTLLAACAKNEPPGKAAAETLAKVNGKTITQSQFEAFGQAAARRPMSEITPEQRAEVLDTLISMRLAADAAEKAGLAKADKVAAQLELSRINVLSDAAFRKYLDDHPITDAEIKAEYDTQVTASGREYRARHILVETRAQAEDMIAQLNRGADFSKLATKNSIDGSANQGGDLGWFHLNTMVPQFAGAVSKLEKGQITTTPVQSQFGWHVIKLDDTRAPTPPPFDDVKDQVKQLVQRKKLQAYVEDLRKTANIQKTEPAKNAAPAAEPAKPAQ